MPPNLGKESLDAEMRHQSLPFVMDNFQTGRVFSYRWQTINDEG